MQYNRETVCLLRCLSHLQSLRQASPVYRATGAVLLPILLQRGQRDIAPAKNIFNSFF